MSFDPRDPADPYDNPGFSGGSPKRREELGPRDPYEYRDPFDPTAGPTDSQKQAARNRLIAPAVILMIAGVCNLLCGGYCVVDSLYINSIPPDQFEKQMEAMQPQNVQNLKAQGISMKAIQQGSFWFYLILGLLTLLSTIIIVAGGACMLGMKMWGLSVTASILAILTPSSFCCMLGLIGGIWGLIALLQSDVRAAYRQS